MKAVKSPVAAGRDDEIRSRERPLMGSVEKKMASLWQRERDRGKREREGERDEKEM